MLLKSSLVKKISIVLSSTAGAQVISFLFVPLITRLYGPEVYGVQSVFLSIVAILTPLGALTLPLAIVLTSEREETNKVIEANMAISIIMFFVIFSCVLIVKYSGFNFFSINDLGGWAYCIPFYLMVTTWVDIIKKDMIKSDKYIILARSNIISSIITNVIKYVGGLFSSTSIMLVGVINVSNLLNSVICYKLNGLKFTCNIKFGEIKQILRQYADFPKYRCPQMLLNAISQDLPVVLLSMSFGLKSAAYYGLCRTLFTAPVNLLGNSLNSVLYPKYVNMRNEGQNVSRLLIKSTLSLMVISIIPFGAFIFFGSQIFTLVFGEEWVMAGHYAKWLAILCFFILISRPSISLIPVIKVQKHFLIIEVFSFILRVVSLLVGIYYYKDELISVELFCLASSLIYVAIILFVFIESKKRHIL
ncbi:oligosaccharide flippase family protein [Vibrio fluvialis]|nr:oligosaccharide flippase family protein [Vibrio fluvialis]